MKLDSSISSWVKSAGSEELSLIVQAVIARYHDLFDEEVIFLSLPTQDPGERTAVLRHVLEKLLHA